MPVDAIGWAASAVLLVTLSRQVWKQWRDRSSEGVSKWLFAGQMTASTLFVVYSWLVDNWVFVFANGALLLTAVIGQAIYVRNTRGTHAKSPLRRSGRDVVPHPHGAARR